MRLEDLRGFNVGDTALMLPDGSMVAAAFHQHAAQAQWHTVNCLIRSSGDPVDGVADERIAVVEWWRTIECIIALVDMVAFLESEAGLRESQPRHTQADNALQRWGAIAKWFSEATYSSPSQTTGRISELRDFRNSFEHYSRSDVIKTQHSRLATVPSHANLADAMEAMAICIEASAVIRHVLTGLDLMPQVLAPSKNHVFYIPLDELATELLFPVYRRLVSRLGLGSDVAMYPSPTKIAGKSLIDLRIVIKGEPNEHDVRCDESIGVWAKFERFAESHPNCPTSDRFGVPGYSTPP